MTACSPRSYHHGDLRKTLLDAAVRHIDAQGTEGLSLRALAREAGVSPTAPYRHFENRTALLAAIATEGFIELREHIGLEDDSIRDRPLLVLYESSLGYVSYARGNAVKYHLMFGDAIGDFSDYEALIVAARRCYGQFEGMLAACVDAGVLEDIPIRELGGTVWSLLHGMAGVVMAADRRLEHPGAVGWKDLPPLEAQQRVLEAPGRAIVRLLRGLVIDADALTELERRAGL